MSKLNSLFVMALLLASSAFAQDVPVDEASALAGGTLTASGETVELYPGSLKVGDDLVAIAKSTGLAFPFKGRVTIVSFIPSIDTPVCILQTQTLGRSTEVSREVDLITVSRDMISRQATFAKDAKLWRLKFASDHQTGEFGKATGLMMKGQERLARGLAVLDKQGIVQYLQIVPDVSHLPNIKKAIEVANELVAKEAVKN